MAETTTNLWTERLRSDEVDVRRIALTELQEEPDAVSIDVLLPLLRDPDATVRLLTVGILEEVGDVRAIPALVEAAAADDRDVANAARVALREFRTPAAAAPPDRRRGAP
jgi:HEAT repeat protein